MDDKQFTITIEEAKKYAAETGTIAKHVNDLLGSSGWKIFISLFLLKSQEIKERSDYPTIEAFKADRRALEIVEGMFSELRGYIEDETHAQETLKKLIAKHQADGQTSNGLRFDQQGEAPEQG